MATCPIIQSNNQQINQPNRQTNNSIDQNRFANVNFHTFYQILVIHVTGIDKNLYFVFSFDRIGT